MITFLTEKDTRNKKYLTFFILLLLLPHFEPTYFDACYSKLDFLYNIARVASGLIVFLFCVFKKGKISVFFLSFAVLEGWMFVVTILHKGILKGFLINIVSLLVLGAIVECFSGQMIKHLIHALLLLLEILIYTNFITILIFPNGLYATEWQSLNWLLGFRNGFIVYILLALCLSMIWKKHTGNSTRFYFLLVVCILTLFRGGSATGLLTLSVFILLYITKIYKAKWFHSYSITGVAIAAWFLLVMIRIQNLFAPFFGLLGRNVTLTGRTYIWDTTIRMIMENPFIGYGKRSAEYRAGLVPKAYAAIDAHNYILEILFVGGIIALLLTAIFFAILLKKLYSFRNHPYTEAILPVLSCYFVILLAESIFTSPLLYTFLFVAWQVKDMVEQLPLSTEDEKKIYFRREKSKSFQVNHANKKICF